MPVGSEQNKILPLAPLMPLLIECSYANVCVSFTTSAGSYATCVTPLEPPFTKKIQTIEYKVVTPPVLAVAPLEPPLTKKIQTIEYKVDASGYDVLRINVINYITSLYIYIFFLL